MSRLDRRAGLVADASDGQHDLGLIRVILDLGAQALHVNVDQTSVSGMTVAPDLLQQHLASEHLTGLLGKADKQVELQRSESKGKPGTRDGVRIDVDSEVTYSEVRVGGILVVAGGVCCVNKKA